MLHACGRRRAVLGPGDAIPTARVWAAPGEPAVTLVEAVEGAGDVLLCFYPFDWSPG
jgi:peroxiredoxin